MKKKRPSRFYDNSDDEFYDAFNPGMLLKYNNEIR